MKRKLQKPFNEERFLENFKTEFCLICQNKEYVDYDFGVSICQTCLYRRNLFLYGSQLRCKSCEMILHDDNFQGWMGESWCRRCLEVVIRELNPVGGRQLGTK